MARSWCIPSFPIVVGSYDVSPPLLSCDELSFPLEVILSDWVFYLRTLEVCLAVFICRDNGISRATRCMSCMCLSVVTMGYQVIHLMYVLVINLRVSWTYAWGWHTFSSWITGRNFGALFEVLCVGWIDESEIVWCISYNHTHGYLRWHWSI